MNWKRIVTVLLLLFVAVSVLSLAFKESKGTGSSGDSVQSVEQATLDESGDKVIAYYFHYLKRCPTCIKIEELSTRVIDERFAQELEEGKVDFHIINVESAGNEHYEDEYQLITQSLVIAYTRDGEQVKWKNLEKIWELVWEEEQFLDYVEREIRAFLEAS